MENYLNKENELHYNSRRKRIQHSPSMFSLKSLISMKRSPSIENITISQPTLDDCSREKVRNKVKHSPSMMSINGPFREPELVCDNEKRHSLELLAYSKRQELTSDVDSLADSHTTHFQHINLNHTSAVYVLQKLQIHKCLSQCSSPDGSRFVPITDLHLEKRTDMEGGYRCALEMPLCGTSLDRTLFYSADDTVAVLLKLCTLLAQAESLVQFEHRNLHAGNILVEQDPNTGHVRRVAVINCELGRITHDSHSLCTPLDHPMFYRPRLPVLAQMRRQVSSPEVYTPSTNVAWLAYVARFLYNSYPSNELKRLEGILEPRWSVRRKPRSASEAYSMLIKRTATH